MRQLVYLSRVAKPLVYEDLKRILDTSRLNNRQSYVTGILLTDGQKFLQALEGERQDVSDALDRISKDLRHYGMKILADRETSQREFGNWAMAANDGSESSFGGRVDAFVAGVTCASIKAKFNNFADYVDGIRSAASPQESARNGGGKPPFRMAR